jgi:SAM-dependent methyltransferase
MERLTFGPESQYDSLEAAIHIARYALVKGICNGRSVLDIACGEGYGTALLADWGASEVVGVDVSADTIDRARKLFPRTNTQFVMQGGEDLGTALSGRQFDVVVSLETIEHVPDARAFLISLRDRVSPGGSLIVSCPNDWWYFPGAEESNPFHRQKYTFEEFRELVCDSIGPPDAWYLGTGASGYANVALHLPFALEPEAPQDHMIEARDLPSLLIPSAPGNTPDVSGASYFVAAWGPEARTLESASVEPVHMDVFAARLSQNRTPDADSRTAIQLASLRALESRMHQLAAQWVAPAISSIALDPMDTVAASRSALLADALARENTWLRERVESLLQDNAAEHEALVQALAEKPAVPVNLVTREDYLRATVRLAHAETAQHQLLREISAVRALCNDLNAELEGLRGSIPVPMPVPIDPRDRLPPDLQARFESLSLTVAELEALRLPAARYYRLSRLVPPPLRRMAVKLVRSIRGS